MILAHWEMTAQVVTATLTAITAVIAFYAKKHSRSAARSGVSIEDAVNHRHSYNNRPPRLYDLALENRRRLTENEFAHANLFESLDRLEKIVEGHILWEQGPNHNDHGGKYDELKDQMRELMAELRREGGAIS